MAWDEIEEQMKEIGGTALEISSSNTSFLAPMVESYGKVIIRRVWARLAYALLFLLSMVCDCAHSSKRALWWSRLFGIGGAFVSAISLLIAFSPDYVSQLDFSKTLSHCGKEFCTAMSQSARAGFSTVMVAEAGITFLPILVVSFERSESYAFNGKRT